MFGRAVGSTICGVGSAVTDVAQTEMVLQTVQEIVSGLDLTEDQIGTGVQGVAIRLFQGDTAQQYLSSQTGISEQEASQRISQAMSRIDSFMEGLSRR